MYSEEIKCKAGHEWSGVKPTIDQNRMSVQHHELMGVICDCNNFVYWEGECGCTVKHWEIQLKQNI